MSDTGQPATLNDGAGRLTDCATLQEAVVAGSAALTAEDTGHRQGDWRAGVHGASDRSASLRAEAAGLRHAYRKMRERASPATIVGRRARRSHARASEIGYRGRTTSDEAGRSARPTLDTCIAAPAPRAPREAGAFRAVHGASEVQRPNGRSSVPSNQASSANPVYAVTIGAGPFTPLWASNSCSAQGPSSPPFGPCRWPVPQFPPVWPSRPPLPGLPGVPKRPFMPALPAWFEYGSTSKIAFWLGCTKA